MIEVELPLRLRRPHRSLSSILLFSILGLSLILSTAKQPDDSLNTEKPIVWDSEDSINSAQFIRDMTQIPQSIDTLVKGCLSREHTLGFGNHLREVWFNPSGKLGFALKIIYSGSHAISFEVKPIMNYGKLIPQYRQILVPTFTVRKGSVSMLSITPYYWNQSKAAEPLPLDSAGRNTLDTGLSTVVREALAFYMTPYSGILYGIRGGQSHQLLENRDFLISLTELLLADRRLARYLLRSLNPASRLSAAEFIIRHHEDFPDYQNLLKTTMKTVFMNPSHVETLRGTAVKLEDARKLVFEYADLDAKRNGRGVLRMY